MVAEPFIAAHTAHAGESVAHRIIHIFGKPVGELQQQMISRERNFWLIYSP